MVPLSGGRGIVLDACEQLHRLLQDEASMSDVILGAAMVSGGLGNVMTAVLFYVGRHGAAVWAAVEHLRRPATSPKAS